MKTPKIEAVCPMAYETFAEVAECLPVFIDNTKRLHLALGHFSPRANSMITTPGRRSKPKPDRGPSGSRAHSNEGLNFSAD